MPDPLLLDLFLISDASDIYRYGKNKQKTIICCFWL